MSEVEFRYMDDGDTENVNTLRQQVTKLHMELCSDFFRADTWINIKDNIRNILNEKDKKIIIEVLDGIVIGYALIKFMVRPMPLYEKETRFLFIEEIGIGSNYRGNGYGTILMDFLIEEARRKGCCKFELGVWNYNTNAIRFYKKYGFKPYRTMMEYFISA